MLARNANNTKSIFVAFLPAKIVQKSQLRKIYILCKLWDISRHPRPLGQLLTSPDNSESFFFRRHFFAMSGIRKGGGWVLGLSANNRYFCGGKAMQTVLLCISTFCGQRITKFLYDHISPSVLKRQLTYTKEKQTLIFTYPLPKTCCLGFKIISPFWAPIIYLSLFLC